MAKEKYDLLVIGAGAAGSSAVTSIARKGKRVALLERNLLSGTCLNYGCDPTKTLLHVARIHHAPLSDSVRGNTPGIRHTFRVDNFFIL